MAYNTRALPLLLLLSAALFLASLVSARDLPQVPKAKDEAKELDGYGYGHSHYGGGHYGGGGGHGHYPPKADAQDNKDDVKPEGYGYGGGYGHGGGYGGGSYGHGGGSYGHGGGSYGHGGGSYGHGGGSYGHGGYGHGGGGHYPPKQQNGN